MRNTIERDRLAGELEQNKTNMGSLEKEVSELEKALREKRAKLKALETTAIEEKLRYEQDVKLLEKEIQQTENDEELLNLRKNRKVLANELKWLRQALSEAKSQQDEYDRVLRVVKENLQTINLKGAGEMKR